jgi:hypothetical protein
VTTPEPTLSTPAAPTVEIPPLTARHSEALARTLFRFAWHRLARDGHCDAYGSVEQERVLTTWLEAGCPLPLCEFIVRHANTSPEVAK